MTNTKPRCKPSSELIKLRTAKQARQWLFDQGLTASQFARDNGLTRDSVNDLLLGRGKASSGNSHAAAVALGMKRNPQIPAVSRQTPRGR